MNISPDAPAADGYTWLRDRAPIPTGHRLLFAGDLSVDVETWRAIMEARVTILVTGTLSIKVTP